MQWSVLPCCQGLPRPRGAAADADGRVCYIGGTVSRPKLSGLCLGALQLGGMVPKIFYVEPYPRHPSRPDHHLPCLLWRHWRLVATGISVGRSLQHLDTYPCYRLLRSTIRIAEVFRSGGLSRQRTRSARWLPLPRRGDGKRPLWTKSILSHPPAADILALLLPRVLSPLP